MQRVRELRFLTVGYIGTVHDLEFTYLGSSSLNSRSSVKFSVDTSASALLCASHSLNSFLNCNGIGFKHVFCLWAYISWYYRNLPGNYKVPVSRFEKFEQICSTGWNRNQIQRAFRAFHIRFRALPRAVTSVQQQ